MRPRHVVVVLTAAGLLASGGVALAKPLPCRLVVDPAGDESPATGYGAPEPATATSGSLDLISGDLATDRTRLTAVARVRKLAWPDPSSPNGWMFTFEFMVAKTDFLVSANKTVIGEEFRADVAVNDVAAGDGTAGAGSRSFRALGAVAGVFDEDRSEVRVTVPLSLMRPYAAVGAGSSMRGLRIEADRQAGENNLPVVAVTGVRNDLATTKASYRGESRNCVVVGA